MFMVQMVNIEIESNSMFCKAVVTFMLLATFCYSVLAGFVIVTTKLFFKLTM